MEELILVLIMIAVVAFVFVMPIVAAVKAADAAREARRARERINGLEAESARQKQVLAEMRQTLAAMAAPGQVPTAAPDLTEKVAVEPPPVEVAAPLQPPPLPAPAGPAAAPPPRPRPEGAAEAALPEHSVRTPRPRQEEAAAGGTAAAAAPPQPAKAPLSLEQFLGVKLFAWLGGIALFFGVIFFVKYAFEHNLVPAPVRVALGFLTGSVLLTGGLWLHRKPAYRVLAQSLCATGVLVLYGVTFAAHAVYHFAAFNPASTFALMSLITVAAFLVAVRLDALVVAVLGMLGGFLTPVLLSTGQDNPLGLFGYIALLDAGLLAVTWRGRWKFLAPAAAAGTVLMQIGWVGAFFVGERYFEGAKTLVPVGVFCSFCALFLAVAWAAARKGKDTLHQSASALGLVTAAMAFAFFFLAFPDISQRTFLLHGFVLLLNLAVLAITVIEPRLALAQPVAAGATFLHLAVWTGTGLKPEMLGGALAAYLVLGGLHAVWPVVRERLRPGSMAGIPRQVGLWLAPLILALMLMPVLLLPELSLVLWPAVLLVDLLVIVLAVLSGAILPVLAALVMTLVVAVAWLFRVPCELASLPPLLVVVAFFAVLFAAAGVWLGKRLAPASAEGAPAGVPWDPARLLPVSSGAMPFVLLVLTVLQLPVANPSPVFGVGLLLAFLLLGLALLGRQPLLAPVALAGTLLLEAVWHGQRFDPANPWIPLSWYLGFYALFTVFPFVFRKTCENRVAPWAASALAGAAHFVLVHDLVKSAFPDQMAGRMGLLPAAFAVPAILALLAVLRTTGTTDHASRSKLAWFGGVALLFITLVFPIQFDRQWLTVSWALEGACLVWLFRRVPHPGLLWTGLALLGVAFFRLTFNPAVFDAYPRSGTRVLNWHLYTYGLAAAAQFLAAWWLPADRRLVQNINLRTLLWSLGGILLFLLLNIEIADFFTAPGQHFIAFQFAGNFARDMTYTISWALFALALLVTGIWCRGRGARLTAIALLVLTLAKLFLHDLATIGNIYRIAALIGVGVITFLASFLYQRFFSQSETP